VEQDVAEPLVWLSLHDWFDPANWSLRAPVVVVLGWLVGGYLLGCGRLFRRGAGSWLARRLVWWVLGTLLLVLALLSPLDELGGLFFSWHMLQHLALLYAAPLLLAGWPLPVLLWALPTTVSRAITTPLLAGRIGARLVDRALRPPVALAAGTVSLWAWHYPPLYDAVLTRRWLHDLEHVTFFLGALLFWWPLVGAPPIRRHFHSDAGRALYLALGGLQSGLLGALVTFWPDVLYHRYLLESIERSHLLADQVFGGLVMWLSGPVVFAIGALATVGANLREASDADSPGHPVTIEAARRALGPTPGEAVSQLDRPAD
jgi:cytochrome c oxidase assembly factor CtaG